MKRIISISLVAMAIFISTSCKKKISPSNSDFIGTWYGVDTELTISQNGKGSYI